MTNQTIINHQYEYLRDFISNLPQTFISEGQYIHDGRNKIKTFNIQGLSINVKRYRIPLFINRLVYVLFRKPKAVRAFDYALKLQQANINTPSPIAYILEKKCCLLGYSYFISIQVPHSSRFYALGKAEINAESETILNEFGKYTALLHEQGIYHQDYSPGNILFNLKNDKPEFYLVDINRMYFGHVSMKKGCANFARLWGSPAMFKIIARAYAQERNFNELETSNEILKARRLYWQKAIRKRPAEFPLEF